MPYTCSGYKFFEYDEIDSTNLEAKRYAQEISARANQDTSLPQEKKDIPVFIAKYQTSGRGRLGRTFFSPEETGLYMSLLLDIEENLIDTDLITPAAGVAVSRTIEALSQKEPKIKWVNDIYIDRKKVCGILAEGIINQKEGKIFQVVLGIGINLFEPKNGFPEEISNIATSLYGKKDEKSEKLKHQFVEKLLENLEKTLASNNENQVMEEYKARSLVLGREVTVITPQKQYTATVKDITKKGHLVVEYTEDDLMKETELLSGEVSLKI